MSGNWLSESVLKQTLLDVERDEAEAIALLVALLDKVRETSRTEPLKNVCAVLNEWQNQPPNAIVRSLAEISKQLNG
jgi:hypothetical protein